MGVYLDALHSNNITKHIVVVVVYIMLYAVILKFCALLGRNLEPQPEMLLVVVK